MWRSCSNESNIKQSTCKTGEGQSYHAVIRLYTDTNNARQILKLDGLVVTVGRPGVMQIPGFRSALCKQLGTQLMVPMEDHLSVEL